MKKKKSVSESLSVMSDSVKPHGLQLAWFLCPWNSPGKNTTRSCHFLLQGSSQLRDRTQVSCITGRLFTRCLSHQGSPKHKWKAFPQKSVSSETYPYLCYSCTVCCECSFMSGSSRPHGLQPTRPHCPWNFPGKNDGVGCHFLLQGIFPIQESNLHLLHCQGDFLPLSHLGSR